MSDDVREYLKAAQEAEVRGDTHQAVENLKKAAVLYRQSGKPARALQMLRQARRLDGRRQDILEELARFEWIPERPPMARAAGGDEEEEALSPLDSIETSFIVPDQKLIERGPTRADPAIPAWCSFCCRPIKETGPLVAGPAGAFICGACVRESRRLLGGGTEHPTDEAMPVVRAAGQPVAAKSAAGAGQSAVAAQTAAAAGQPAAQSAAGHSAAAAFTSRSTDVTGPPSFGAAALASAPTGSASAAPEAFPFIEFTGQAEALKVLDAAMRLNVRLVLILGPEGCGKTAYLKDLERRGLGHYVAEASAAASSPPGQRLLIDAGGPRQGQLGEADLPWLLELLGEDPSRQVLVALRGQPPAPAFAFHSEEAELPLFSSSELVLATEGRLPAALASQVQVTAPFRPLNLAELTEVARRLAARRAADLDLSDELLGAVAEEGLRSGRGGRELEAVIDRLPPGSWNLLAGSKPKPRKGRKKAAPKEG